jgi:hypothetical protein
MMRHRLTDRGLKALKPAPKGKTRDHADYDPIFERHMAVARDVMKRRRNALRELAKR